MVEAKQLPPRGSDNGATVDNEREESNAHSQAKAIGIERVEQSLSTCRNEFSLSATLEALLFVADGPVEVTQLATLLNLGSETICQGLQQLDRDFVSNGRGLRIQEYNGTYQLVTKAVLAPLIETFLNLDTSTKLSATALETLAIVAYRQPVTRAQVEAVRGVDSAAMLRSLVQRGLIQESGRLEGVGRPILYSVTENFMLHFGLTGLDELPTLETTEADTLWAATTLAESQEETQTS
ncbi:MAG: SMC-Scp complex subunit ScpB [Caldilineaceae bacterium]